MAKDGRARDKGYWEDLDGKREDSLRQAVVSLAGQPYVLINTKKGLI